MLFLFFLRKARLFKGVGLFLQFVVPAAEV